MASLRARISAAASALFANEKATLPIQGEYAMGDPYHLIPRGQHERYNPSELVTLRGLRVYDRMRRDDQIKAALAFKKFAIFSTGWEIVSPEGQEEDWEVSRFVKAQLEGLEDGLESALLSMLTALDFGYSVSEKIYSPIEDGEWSGKIGLKALRGISPHGLTFITDSNGNLDEFGIKQSASGDKPYPSAKFVRYVHDQEFGNPYGRSDIEAAYRAWWVKENSYNWLPMMLERYGIPPLIALYDPNKLQGRAVTDLKTVLSTLQSSTSGVIPRPNKEAIELWAPELAGQVSSVFIPTFDMLNKDIARAILMPGLLGATPDGESGSFARSRVIFDVFMFVIEFLRQKIAVNIMQRQIVEQLIDVNYASGEYPIFRWLPFTDQDLEKLLDRWSTLASAGVVKSMGEDENHIRSLMEFPERDVSEDEEIEEDPSVPPGEEDEEGDEEEGDTDEDGEEEAKKEEELAKNARRAVFSRRPNKYERHCNFAAAAEDMEQASEQNAPALVGALKGALDDFEPGILAGYDLANVRDLTFPLARSQDAARAIENTLLQAFRSGRNAGRSELAQASTSLAAKFADPVSYLPTEAIEYLKAKAITVAGVLSQRVLADVKEALLFGLKTGEVPRETMRRLSDVLNPYIGGTTPTGKEKTPSRVETILRTNSTDAYNQGRLSVYREPDVAELLEGVEYSAIIDERTTEVCRHLDGRIFRVGDPALDRLTPPNHFNCRSVLVPVTPDVDVDEKDRITPGQIGRAIGLAGNGFA